MCQNVNLSDLLVLDVLRDDPVLSFLTAPEDEPTAKKYCISALIAAAETHGLSGNLLPRYLLHVLTSRANLVSETMERTDLPPVQVCGMFFTMTSGCSIHCSQHRRVYFSVKRS